MPSTHVNWTHEPLEHVPPAHEVPSAAFGFEHVPVPALQVPATWQASSGVHVTGLLPVHVPAWHVSVCVQRLPSLHVVPFALFGFEHTPVPGLQVPTSWH